MDDFVFASVWNPSSVATAVGDIVAGAVGGVVLVMMHSNARRSVLRPFGYLELGITDIAGGLGRLLGGVPIAILSSNFLKFHSFSLAPKQVFGYKLWYPKFGIYD